MSWFRSEEGRHAEKLVQENQPRGTIMRLVTLAAAVVTLVSWSLAGTDASYVIERVVTVLVIA